jgi:translation initiation factor 2 alpha subunit (eIF-2alpha)
LKKSRIRTTLELLVLLPGLVDVIKKSLNPDNANLPEDLKLEVIKVNEDRLKIIVEAGDIGTIINTMNDIFSCLQPLLKLLSKGNTS